MTRVPLPVRPRYDPERLEAVSRSVSGRTRCPDCDTVNPAGQKYCDRCGSALYPEWDPESPAEKDSLDLFELLFDPDERTSSNSSASSDGRYAAPYPPISLPESIVMACPRCHAKNPEANNYCGKCGARLVPDVQQSTGEDKKGRSGSGDIDKPAYYK